MSMRRGDSHDGSSTMGVNKFFQKTGRISARDWEDTFTLTHIDTTTGELKKELAEDRDCPICGRADPKPIFTKQGFVHNKCPGCETIFVSPSIKRKEFYELWYGTDSPYPFFDTVNSAAQRQFDHRRFAGVLDVLASMSASGTMLDVGAGGGFFLELAAEYGWQVEGVDIYPRAVAHAQERGLNVKLGDFNKNLYADRNFNFISLWEVLDLVPEPMQILDDAIELLSNGGMLGLSFRNAFSLAAMIMREKCNVFIGSCHFQLMTFETMKSLLASKGLVLIWDEGYISEGSVLSNYLSYEDPYTGQASKAPQPNIFSDEFIHSNKLSYKFTMLFQKLRSPAK